MTGPAAMRASDADRDRVADQLREALAEGRLTPDEHAERIDAVYAAKTYAELAPLLQDLPSGETGWLPGADDARPKVDLRKDQVPPPPVQQSTNIIAILGGADRKGRWLVEPYTNVFTLCGGVDLDFREAVLSQREVTVNITCLLGGVTIKVPPGVRVVNSNAAIMGGHSGPDDDPLDADAPVIRLTGLTVCGGIEVKRKESKEVRRERRRQLRDEARDRRRALRDERQDRLRELRESRRRRHY